VARRLDIDTGDRPWPSATAATYIACLGEDALHDLREALATIFTLPAADEHSFAALGGLHGTPGNFCQADVGRPLRPARHRDHRGLSGP